MEIFLINEIKRKKVSSNYCWTVFFWRKCFLIVQTMEKRPRETILCREFATSVAYINHKLPKTDRIWFIQLDLHLFAKRSVTIYILKILCLFYWFSYVTYMNIFFTESKHFRQNKSINMLEILENNAADMLDRVGFYCSGKNLHNNSRHDELK